MAGLCRLQLIGYVGGDAETRYLPSDDSVAQFSVAYSEKWRDKATGEARERTTWFSVSAWGKLGEIAGEYVRKGNQIYVEGQLYAETWKDKQGEQRTTLKVRADRIVLLGRREDGAKPAAQKPTAREAGSDDDLGDVPF